MLVRLRLDETALRRWHRDLLAALSRRPGTTAEFALVRGGAGALPATAEALFRFEALVHSLPGQSLLARVAAGDLQPWRPTGRTPGLTIDLAGGADAAQRLWRLSCNGSAGETALFAALIAGEAPLATLHDGDRLVAAGRLGTEHYGQIRPSLEDALARTTTLILAALDGAPTAAPASWGVPVGTERPFTSLSLAATMAHRVAGTAARRLYKLAYRTPHWRVGWRRVAGPDVIDLKAHPPGGWTDLADDRRRFYADPFPIEHDGRVVLFVEEYPHATRKGIISAVGFGPDGPDGAPEPVLERPYHLSYPFVFARDGDVWMIPESGAAGTVDLYRATRFPGGWVKAATLVADVVASDATLCEHEGRWWLFATVQPNGGSSSDALCLWTAPDFRGPWRPHSRNPVLIDAASARPGGRMVRRDGALWRPVQDCRKAYGGALGLARVLRLDLEGFDQQVEAVLSPGAAWRGTLLHTLNRAGPLEFIDGSAHARR